MPSVRRPLTQRESDVLNALLSVEFVGVEDLRAQAQSVMVLGACGCGCPSIDFYVQRGVGMHVRVNAAIKESHDGLFLYTLGDRVGGIEYVGVSDERGPEELPDPARLTIEPA